MTLTSQIESLLFIAGKSLSIKEIVHELGCPSSQVTKMLGEMKSSYELSKSGIRIVFNEHSAEMVTAPENSGIIRAFIRNEQSTITQAKIETLTILAYAGPLSKEVLEHIRGVNCTLILKNLKIEELLEEYEEKNVMHYQVSTKFLKALGVPSIQNLPGYSELSRSLSKSASLNA